MSAAAASPDSGGSLTPPGTSRTEGTRVAADLSPGSSTTSFASSRDERASHAGSLFSRDGSYTRTADGRYRGGGGASVRRPPYGAERRRLEAEARLEAESDAVRQREAEARQLEEIEARIAEGEARRAAAAAEADAWAAEAAAAIRADADAIVQHSRSQCSTTELAAQHLVAAVAAELTAAAEAERVHAEAAEAERRRRSEERSRSAAAEAEVELERLNCALRAQVAETAAARSEALGKAEAYARTARRRAEADAAAAAGVSLVDTAERAASPHKIWERLHSAVWGAERGESTPTPDPHLKGAATPTLRTGAAKRW